MFDWNLSWKKSGQKVSAAEVGTTAANLGLIFPPDYVKFLETTNGGVPSRRMFASSAGDQTISYFYDLDDLPREVRHFRSELDLPATLVPIALADQNLVLLSGNKVQLWYLIESGFSPGRICDLADSLDAFLERLQKKLVKPKFDMFVYAIALGETARVQKFIQDGIDVNGGGEESAADQAITAKEWKILEILLAAGANRTLPNGSSVDEALREELLGQAVVLKAFGPDSKLGLKATAAIEDIERILQRFFP